MLLCCWNTHQSTREFHSPFLFASNAGPFLPSKLPLIKSKICTPKYVIPWVHPSPRHKRHLDHFSPFCTLRQIEIVPMLYNGPPFHPQNCPFSLGDLSTHLTSGSLRQLEFPPQTASRSDQPFSERSRLWQTIRPTDRQIDRRTIGCIYVAQRSL